MTYRYASTWNKFAFLYRIDKRETDMVNKTPSAIIIYKTNGINYLNSASGMQQVENAYRSGGD
ncbi:MAG: hypothetical protein ACOH2A_12115 [Sphingobacteriaceae bacterium]